MDYGAALVSLGNHGDAERVFKSGLRKCCQDRRGLPTLRNEYTQFPNDRESFTEAHEQLEDSSGNASRTSIGPLKTRGNG